MTFEALISPESQKPRQRVGIADRKVFARPESFCAYQQNWFEIKSKQVSGQSGRFPDSLEI